MWKDFQKYREVILAYQSENLVSNSQMARKIKIRPEIFNRFLNSGSSKSFSPRTLRNIKKWVDENILNKE